MRESVLIVELNLTIRSCFKCHSFKAARGFAVYYEQLTGRKHHLWEQIIAGLVEQDEAERYG